MPITGSTCPRGRSRCRPSRTSAGSPTGAARRRRRAPKRPVTLEIEADGITRAVVLDPQIGQSSATTCRCARAGGERVPARQERGRRAHVFRGRLRRLHRQAQRRRADRDRAGSSTMAPVPASTASLPCARVATSRSRSCMCPAKLKLDEAIVEVDAKGNRTPLDCKALPYRANRQNCGNPPLACRARPLIHHRHGRRAPSRDRLRARRRRDARVRRVRGPAAVSACARAVPRRRVRLARRVSPCSRGEACSISFRRPRPACRSSG